MTHRTALAVVAAGLAVASLASSPPVHAAGLATPPPVSGRADGAVATLQPSDVLARVHLVAAEVELVRAAMGRTQAPTLQLVVEGAEPREVLFQALALYRSADRLAFELNGETRKPPTPPSADRIRPGHVSIIVDAALARVLQVKQHLGITETVVEVAEPETRTPSDVFMAIIDLTRQLDRLLDQEVGSGDVYEEITRAIHLAARLLAHRGAPVRYPDPPTFVPAKTPGDVYLQLVGCFEKVRAIAARYGLDVLRLDVSRERHDKTPGEVYGIARLLVSELAYVHANQPDIAPPAPAYFPGRKFPSHGFQRAGLLEAQLDLLIGLGAPRAPRAAP